MHVIHSDSPADDPLYQYNFAAACHLEPVQDSDNGWMLSFVDLLTLLLTLFVLLLAFTRHSQSTAHHDATAGARANTPIRSAAAPVAKSGASPAPMAASRHAVEIGATSTAAATKPGAGVSRQTASTTPHATGPATVRSSPASVQKANPATASAAAASQAPPFTIPADIRKQVEIAASARRVNLIIRDDVLFDPGSADLKPAAHALLKRIAGLLKENSYRVSVEGHTDNRPIHTAQFPSNWELSACRATNVTRYLISQGIAANRLQAIGYADTRPRAGNGDAAGRARNRRVSLVVHLRKSGDERTAATKVP